MAERAMVKRSSISIKIFDGFESKFRKNLKSNVQKKFFVKSLEAYVK